MLLANRDREERPWGFFERFTLNEPSTVKIIHVDADQGLSLQTHEKRSEFWYIVEGGGEVTVGDEVVSAKPGNEFMIAAQTPHRATAGPEGLTFLEVALGEFIEHDEVRLQDSYGRGSPTA